MKQILLISTCSLAAFFLFAFTQITIKTANAPGKIQFIGDAGQATTFTVEDWKFLTVTMQDDKPENIYAEIEMETSSINAGWKELVQSVKKKTDYFHVKSFPKASVVIKGATKNEEGTYQTTAQITIKKITKPVVLTFSISDTKPYKVQGRGTIIRQDFDFNGGGPKDEVPLMFEAVLPLK